MMRQQIISLDDIVCWPAGRHGIVFISLTDCDPCISIDVILRETIARRINRPIIYKLVVDRNDKRAIGKAIKVGITSFPLLSFIGPKDEVVISEFDDGKTSISAEIESAIESTFGDEWRR